MAREFSKSPETDWRVAAWLAAAVLVSMTVYLLVAAATYRPGFPLDDAWIHQTYARNLAVFGEWAFYPGQPSGGSTAPLWSALLSVGYVLGLPHFLWTHLLGGICLWLLALVCEITARKIIPGYQPRLPWVGLFFAFEWRLVWAAASGMETILHALLIITVFGLLLAGVRRYALFGLLVGISVWVRPDGVTLLGPLGLLILVENRTWRGVLGAASRLSVGLGVLVIFYLLFNLWVAGTPWPNTFYAKQAEYAELLSRPLIERLAEQFVLPMVGAGVILMPGVVGWVARAVRQKDWATLAALLWFLGYLALYALRLPVTYQHGRYIIPAMPILFFLGLLGYLHWFRSPTRTRFRWALGAIIKSTTVSVLVLFWLLGARAYAQGVAVIESEMVDTAHWVASNLPADALIAAHDIGALGYFTQRPLVDLAGLVTPEVIPFIRDETQLAAYMAQKEVDYLITFPDWYPILTSRYRLVRTTEGIHSPALGGENMAVYALKP